MLSRYELTAYADDGGEIDLVRLRELITNAETLGANVGAVEYVEPIPGGDPQPWGLRIVIEGDE